MVIFGPSILPELFVAVAQSTNQIRRPSSSGWKMRIENSQSRSVMSAFVNNLHLQEDFAKLSTKAHDFRLFCRLTDTTTCTIF